MFYISDIYTTSPEKFETQLQEKAYRTLNELCINFERVETDVAITMENCVEINKKLVVKMVKTLFLCNRQKQTFIRLLLVVIKDLILKSLVVS